MAMKSFSESKKQSGIELTESTVYPMLTRLANKDSWRLAKNQAHRDLRDAISD